jgi:hypothetical protein
MQFRFGWNKLIFSAALLLGSAVSAYGETVAGTVAQAPSSELEFAVIEATKDETHPFFGKGNPLGFVINGVQGRVLTLVRGKTYTFNVSTGPMHDFYISKGPQGWGGGTLTEGVDGNFTYQGSVTFSPSAATPDIVYYACRNHQFMGGEIRIVNAGAEGKAK